MMNDEVEEALIRENVPLTIIKKVRRAMRTTSGGFEQALAEIPQKSIAQKIRDEAAVVDNRLIDKWRAELKVPQNSADISLIPGFAKVRFSFLDEHGKAITQYPCLPVRHQKYGLLYYQEGQTVAAAPEIVLALELGAKIEALTSLELPVERDADGKPVRIAFDHITALARERDRYAQDKSNPKAKVMERLVKEFMNSFYGKFSQAINLRNMYSPATGEYFPMGNSLITEPCTASLVTSQARAVLSSMLIAIERFNTGRGKGDRITVISATTDGLLIGVPANSIDVMREYYGRR